jgi:hypothetical protein
MFDPSYVGLFATNLSGTELRVQNIIPANGTLKNFFVFIENAPGSGDSWTFVVRKNGVSSAVTCVISGSTATSCSDLTHTETFAPGDLISIKITHGGSPTNARMQWTALFGP